MMTSTTTGIKTYVITTFFNPHMYRSRIKNYRIFREHLKKQGIPLLVVECAFRKRNFELTTSDAEIVVSVRSDSLLWQKERLLNIALQHLPISCENIAWIDADIILLNNNWREEAEQLLEKYNVIQLFSEAIRLEKKQSFEDIDKDSGAENKLLLDSSAKEGFASFVCRQKIPIINYATEGGFAWAAQRKMLDTCGFYDRGIIGGGDWVMNSAFLNIENNNPFSKKWSQEISRCVNGRVYFVAGRAIHLYHGSLEGRQYGNRSKILSLNNFNPDRDLSINASGCWEWVTTNTHLKKEVERYFSIRNEDDSLLKKVFAMIRGHLRH